MVDFVAVTLLRKTLRRPKLWTKDKLRDIQTCCPSIFILTVGANLLCGDWNIGIGELRLLPRQTVILRQTPAHPRPSLHLSDLERCFRKPPLSLPPTSFLRSLGEKEGASLKLITISKISHKNRFTWPRIRLVAEGTALTDSKCLWKLRHWVAKQCFSIQPNTGASIPDLTPKVQWGVKRGLTITPWPHCNLGQ